MHRVDIDFPVSAWLVDASIVPPEDELAWLGPAEVNRALRFRDPRHRSRYLATHVALRLIVASAHRIAPQDQHFERDPLGRWRLIGAEGPELSWSYAGTSALIALSTSARIGIDVEQDRIVPDADQLAETCFDPAERHEYAATAGVGRSRALLSGWTRKEAALKAIGVGLQRAPETIHTGLYRRSCLSTESQRIEIMSFEAFGLIGAVARMTET